jgi:hypothetical protein
VAGNLTDADEHLDIGGEDGTVLAAGHVDADDGDVGVEAIVSGGHEAR